MKSDIFGDFWHLEYPENNILAPRRKSQPPVGKFLAPPLSLWPEIYHFLSQAPMLKGLHYPGKLGQCTNAHFPGAYQGTNSVFLSGLKSVPHGSANPSDVSKHASWTRAWLGHTYWVMPLASTKRTAYHLLATYYA